MHGTGPVLLDEAAHHRGSLTVFLHKNKIGLEVKAEHISRRKVLHISKAKVRPFQDIQNK